jgi:predicted ATP-dependent endonuclease of OLD family
MFFCDRLVLVEGPEDVAFLSSLIVAVDRYDEFRRVGGHIVPVMGKDRLIRPMIVAQEAAIDTCVVADADLSQGAQSRTSTERICKGLGYPDVPSLPHISRTALIWQETLAAWFKGEVGEETWKEAVQDARRQISPADAPGEKNVQLIALAVDAINERHGLPNSVQDVVTSVIGQ